MDWIWALYRDFVHKQFERTGVDNPSDADVEKAFLRLLAASTVTVLVQEPWQNSVRFKELARYDWNEMGELVNDPMAFLQKTFGGGKFKLNFHDGWNFIATQNFKPEGEPRWKNLP